LARSGGRCVGAFGTDEIECHGLLFRLSTMRRRPSSNRIAHVIDVISHARLFGIEQEDMNVSPSGKS
jgi:hypothetical protein